MVTKEKRERKVWSRNISAAARFFVPFLSSVLLCGASLAVSVVRIGSAKSEEILGTNSWRRGRRQRFWWCGDCAEHFHWTRTKKLFKYLRETESGERGREGEGRGRERGKGEEEREKREGGVIGFLSELKTAEKKTTFVLLFGTALICTEWKSSSSFSFLIPSCSSPLVPAEFSPAAFRKIPSC